MAQAHAIERIIWVLKYIDEHLYESLSLDKVAAKALYSPFHLHRIFKDVTGETLNNYIVRKRLERVAFLLMFRKDIPVAELATETGFSSNATLSRAFSKFYGVSPTRFRSLVPGEYSKICKPGCKIQDDGAAFEKYFGDIDQCLKEISAEAKIEVRRLARTDIAYVTCIGVESIDDSFNTMYQWARKAQLTTLPDFRFIRLFHDSFRITKPDVIRMSIGVPVANEIKTKGAINSTTIPAGKYLTARLRIAPPDFGKSWEQFFIWMNENGYKKAQSLPFEQLFNDFRTAEDGKSDVELCIPIF